MRMSLLILLALLLMINFGFIYALQGKLQSDRLNNSHPENMIEIKPAAITWQAPPATNGNNL